MKGDTGTFFDAEIDWYLHKSKQICHGFDKKERKRALPLLLSKSLL